MIGVIVLACATLGADALQEPTSLEVTAGATQFKIDPWGHNALRVRASINGPVVDFPGRGALLPPGSDNKGHPVRHASPLSQGKVKVSKDENKIQNGDILATISADGLVTISKSGGEVILTEYMRGSPSPPTPPPAPPTPPQNNTGFFTFATNNSQASCSAGPCCLDLSNWDSTDHAGVAISNCHRPGEFKNGDSNQHWHYDNSSGHITVQMDGKCLRSPDPKRVEVADCDSSDAAQQWSMGSANPTQIVHSTKMCLTVDKQIDSGSISLSTCTQGAVEQFWTVETPPSGPIPPPPPSNKLNSVGFTTDENELLFGFGEHQQGKLMIKDQSFDMESCLDYGKSHGGEVCLPWIISATAGKGVNYGFLWNMPNYGGVDFAKNNESQVLWSAEDTTQTDYFITIPDIGSTPNQTANQVMSSYVDAVGHAPLLPAYAAGYWHSKNRYSTQDDLLQAAEGFVNRSINVSVIVIDYNHWPLMGDWSFDPQYWPDIPGMMQKLESYGMKVMVSAWPFSAVNSTSFQTIGSQGFAVTVQGTDNPTFWNDNNCGDTGGVRGRPCYLYDPTQESARKYFWSRLSDGYYKHGIKIFWLDASEPEISTGDARNAAMDYNSSIGTGQDMGMMFPYYHTQSIHDGLLSEGESEVVMLTRSAWAGMQRFGAALWSGDTVSKWPSLQVSIQAGLNTQMSGIAWWTTDIGGYAGGDPNSPDFRQLIVRWFQFGLTCPLFRQHGARSTEPWGYGNESLAAIESLIQMRTKMEPYIMEQMQLVSASGVPINRPLWWDFPEDPNTWSIDDSYMFGSDYIACPVTAPNVTTWTCYLPALAGGSMWTHVFTGAKYAGGKNVTTDTPLDQFPLFQK